MVLLLVQRHLAHTVDGVVGIVELFRHAVGCPLHHHAATEDTAEVGTLDGVHDTSGIDRYHTVLLPNRFHGLAGGVDDICSSCKQGQQLVLGQGGTGRIGRPGIVGTTTLSYAFVFHLIVSLFTRRQEVILFNGNLSAVLVVDVVVVGAVVGDVQLAVAVDQRQVAIAVETTGMSRTDGDEVTVVDVVDGGSGITEHRGDVGIHTT